MLGVSTVMRKSEGARYDGVPRARRLRTPPAMVVGSGQQSFVFGDANLT